MNTPINESSVACGAISSAQELIDEYLCHNEAPEPGREITKKEVDRLLHKISQSLGTAEIEQWQSNIAKILESYKQQYGWKINHFKRSVQTTKTERTLMNESAFMLSSGYLEVIGLALKTVQEYQSKSSKVNDWRFVAAISLLVADESGRFDAKTIEAILSHHPLYPVKHLLIEPSVYQDVGLLMSPGLLLLRNVFAEANLAKVPSIDRSVKRFLADKTLSHLPNWSLKQLRGIYQQINMSILSPLMVSHQSYRGTTPLRIEHLFRLMVSDDTLRLVQVQDQDRVEERALDISNGRGVPQGFANRSQVIQAFRAELKLHDTKGKKRYQKLRQWLHAYLDQSNMDQLTYSIVVFFISMADPEYNASYATSTLMRYLSALNPLLEVFEYRCFSTLDTDRLAIGFQALLNKTASNVSSTVVPRYIHFIRHMIPNSIRLIEMLNLGKGGGPADARLLGPKEGRDLIQRLISSDNREDVGNGLIIALGFFCGLRPAETMGLRIADIEGTNRAYLRVKSNQHRGLKTPRSNRTLSLRALLPADIFSALLQLKRDRLEESKGNTERRLFRPLKSDSTDVTDGRIGDINALLKEQTGDPGFSYHNLRHSFANWFFLKLFMAAEPGLRSILETFITFDSSFDPAECESVFRQEINMSPSHGSRYILQCVSQALGHTSPSVTLKSYIHILPLIEYAMKSLKRQPIYQHWAEIMLYPTAGKHGYNIRSRLNEHQKGFSYALSKHCIHHLADLVTPEKPENLPQFEKVPKLKARKAPKVCSVTISQLPVLIQSLIQEGRSVDRVARSLNLNSVEVERIYEICTNIQNERIHSNKPRSKFPKVLTRVVGKEEKAFQEQLFDRIKLLQFDWQKAYAAEKILKIQLRKNLIPLDFKTDISDFLELFDALQAPLGCQVFQLVKSSAEICDYVESKGGKVDSKLLDIPYTGNKQVIYFKPVNPANPSAASPALKNTLMLCYIWRQYLDS